MTNFKQLSTSLKVNIKSVESYQVKTDQRNKPYITIILKNGRLIKSYDEVASIYSKLEYYLNT